MDKSEMKDTDIAFLKGLDDNRYRDFKVAVINDTAKRAMKQPGTQSEIYLLASRNWSQRKKQQAQLLECHLQQQTVQYQREVKETLKKDISQDKYTREQNTGPRFCNCRKFREKGKANQANRRLLQVWKTRLLRKRLYRNV